MTADTIAPHLRNAVIVAEKHPIARAVLAALLSSDGYRVFQAENLEEAIAHIDSVPDLAAALVDLDMPGWKTLVRLAAVDSSHLLIAMEGRHAVSKKELEQRGVQRRLRKPIAYNDVRLALRSHGAAAEVVSIPTESLAKAV